MFQETKILFQETKIMFYETKPCYRKRNFCFQKRKVCFKKPKFFVLTKGIVSQRKELMPFVKTFDMQNFIHDVKSTVFAVIKNNKITPYDQPICTFSA